MQGRIIRGTTLIYYFQHQSINRLGNNASVAHQSTHAWLLLTSSWVIYSIRLCTGLHQPPALCGITLIFSPNHHL